MYDQALFVRMLSEFTRHLLEPHDIDTYVAMSRMAQAVEHGDVIEYWKSSPYLLNFMDDYQFKH